MSEFYEDDEPIEKIAQAFGGGPHLVTSSPVDRWSSTAGPRMDLTIVGARLTGVPTWCGQPMRRSP